MKRIKGEIYIEFHDNEKKISIPIKLNGYNEFNLFGTILAKHGYSIGV